MLEFFNSRYTIGDLKRGLERAEQGSKVFASRFQLPLFRSPPPSPPSQPSTAIDDQPPMDTPVFKT